MSAEGYDYRTRSTGEVVIFHHGKARQDPQGGRGRDFRQCRRGR
ncbi:hypothetical protein [Demequina litorisediminis]|nr:hypothetical protein [Demequina litorisediminis]